MSERPLWRLPLCLICMCGGLPVTAWDDDGNLWCAWQCATCGAIKHAHKTGTRSVRATNTALEKTQ